VFTRFGLAEEADLERHAVHRLADASRLVLAQLGDEPRRQRHPSLASSAMIGAERDSAEHEDPASGRKKHGHGSVRHRADAQGRRLDGTSHRQ
jgi:hypothetical protein